MKRFLALLLCVFGALASPMRAEVELSFDFYYDQLSPLGEWAEVEGYGYVWHPNAVDEDWAPYTDGYWSYTDAGWTWVSYEDWGGITYHYGRWTRIEDYGWCWVPGYEWGPAWVSWRKNDDYVGWAPLPPECDWQQDRGVGVWVDVNFDIGPRYYNFCRVRDFGAPVIRHVLFPRIRNVDICFSTVNITNISYNYDYGCVYNGGFDYDYIRARCERPVPAFKLVQNTTNIYINNNGGNVVVNAPRGNALVVAAPRLATNYRQYTRKPAALKTFKRDAVVRGWNGLDQQETRQRLVSKMREETKGLTPVNAPARPVAKEALAVVPKQVDLEARPAGLKRATAERPARTSAAVQVPVDPQAITTPSRDRRIEKTRPGSRGETAETPVTQPVVEPRGRNAETPRETPRTTETPVAGTDDNKAGGLRKRPGRPEGEPNSRPVANEPLKPAVEERGAEAGKPGRMPVPRGSEPRGPVTGQEPPVRERMEQPERGPGLRRPAADDNAARQAQENAERANAERQMKQREQAEAAQNAAERAQRQRNAEAQQQNTERAAEMQRNAQAQENANRAARENAMREQQANRARVDQAEAAQRQNAQREAAERAAAGQRERAAEVQRERAMDAQRERAAAQQAEAQRERAAQQQNEARQRAAEAQRERAAENQRAAAQAQQAEARQRAMEAQRERAASQQAAQQNEARQRAAEAQRERAMENQRAAAAQAQAQQRAAAQERAQSQAAAQAQAQAQAQQRAAAENARRQQQAPQPQNGEDPRKKKRGE